MTTPAEHCTCGANRDKQIGYRLDTDASSPYVNMWVHAQCGKPAKPYLDSGAG
jgi:hypothetical protein